MAGLRMLHRTVLEALVEIDAAGEALSFQVFLAQNYCARDGRFITNSGWESVIPQ